MDKQDIIDALERIEESLATVDSLLDDIYDEFHEIDFDDIIDDPEEVSIPFNYEDITQHDADHEFLALKVLVQRIESDLESTQEISDLRVFVSSLKEKIGGNNG